MKMITRGTNQLLVDLVNRQGTNQTNKGGAMIQNHKSCNTVLVLTRESIYYSRYHDALNTWFDSLSQCMDSNSIV